MTAKLPTLYRLRDDILRTHITVFDQRPIAEKTAHNFLTMLEDVASRWKAKKDNKGAVEKAQKLLV